MIAVQVTGVSQEFNFKTHAQETFAVFVLPNGHQFRAPITDETATMLVNIAIAGGGPPTQSNGSGAHLPSLPPLEAETPVANGFVSGAAPDGSPASVFGGDFEPPAVVTEDRIVPTVTAVRPKLMGKDSSGYPIMQAADGVDPDAISPGLGEGDEDGVRSV